MLRQQTEKPAGRPNRCLADYIAPAGDHLGGFAVAIHGAERAGRAYEAAHDDYRAIMVKALADRLAEAFAEYIHLRGAAGLVRAGRRPGARGPARGALPRASGPALGYPASPDHSQKQELFDLLEAEQLGMGLTESFAMTPAASVSGLIFAHPAVPLLHASAGSAGTRSRTTPPAAACRVERGRALAAAQPGLRPGVMSHFRGRNAHSRCDGTR